MSTSHLRLLLLLSLVVCVSTATITNVPQNSCGHNQQPFAHTDLSSTRLVLYSLMCVILATALRLIDGEEGGSGPAAAPADGGEGGKGSATVPTAPPIASTKSSPATPGQGYTSASDQSAETNSSSLRVSTERKPEDGHPEYERCIWHDCLLKSIQHCQYPSCEQPICHLADHSCCHTHSFGTTRCDWPHCVNPSNSTTCSTAKCDILVCGKH